MRSRAPPRGWFALQLSYDIQWASFGSVWGPIFGPEPNLTSRIDLEIRKCFSVHVSIHPFITIRPLPTIDCRILLTRLQCNEINVLLVSVVKALHDSKMKVWNSRQMLDPIGIPVTLLCLPSLLPVLWHTSSIPSHCHLAFICIRTLGPASQLLSRNKGYQISPFINLMNGSASAYGSVSGNRLGIGLSEVLVCAVRSGVGSVV
jgi:hypothetical protein